MGCVFHVVCEIFVLEPSIRQPDLFLTYRGAPVWKRLIDHPLTSDERVSLIAEIFSNRDETEIVKNLRGEDAQFFVDVIDQVIYPK